MRASERWVALGQQRLPLLAVAALFLGGCPPNEHIAHVSDTYVVVAGTSGGAVVSRPKPIEGKPLVDEIAAGARCTPAADLLAKLGPVCSHESENPVAAGGGADPNPGAATDDLEPGKHKRTRQIHWYCGAQLDVRVVFEPCDGDGDGRDDGIAPVEVAVAIHQQK